MTANDEAANEQFLGRLAIAVLRQAFIEEGKSYFYTNGARRWCAIAGLDLANLRKGLLQRL